MTQDVNSIYNYNSMYTSYNPGDKNSINLPLFSTVLPSNSCCLYFNTHKTCWKFCINNERPTGQKQQLLNGRTVENKGKLILTEIFPSVQKHDI
jgi:hypothetical protein